jgi:hypothetical protein
MVVVSVMEITAIVLLVMVWRAASLMARIIEHDAIVRKGRVGRRGIWVMEWFRFETGL